MTLEIPDSPKIYTTTYTDFKGVDYTNDATNVWKKRSPSGVNMLPDASGRPFKRKGWEVIIDNDTLCSELSVTGCTISKCCWFTIAGCPHIAIFTDCGVLFYRINENGQGEFTQTNTDIDCYSSYDRTFFFEGDGTSAFYIYGNGKVWKYDDTFTLIRETYDYENNEGVYIPTVIFSASAESVGEQLESYNLLGDIICIQYNSMKLNYAWGNEKVIFAYTALEETTDGEYEFSYDGTDWKVKTGGVESTVSDMGTYGIAVTSATTGARIMLVKGYCIMLPNNVSQEQIQDIDVRVTVGTQFSCPLEVISGTSTPTSGEVAVHTDTLIGTNAWLVFGDDWTPEDVSEDFIKVSFPSSNVVITRYDGEAGHEACPEQTQTATLVE